MTWAAQSFSKDLSNFMESPETKEYLSALRKSLESREYVQAKRGRNGGT